MKLFLTIILFSFFLSNCYSQDIEEFEDYSVLLSLTSEIPQIAPNGDTTLYTKFNLFGTGFIIYDDIIGTNSYYLITNKHIVADENDGFYTQINVNIKSETDYIGQLGLPIVLVKEKNKSIKTFKESFLVDTLDFELLWRTTYSVFSDLAVIKFNSFKEYLNGLFKSKNKAIKLSESISYKDIKLADNVFSFGFPAMSSLFRDSFFNDSLRKYELFDFGSPYQTILRTGIVSAKPLGQLETFQNKEYIIQKFLILEMKVNGGQSGSPVFLIHNNNTQLCGVISSTFADNDLSKAWPVDYIIQIILDNKEFFKSEE